MCIRDRYMSVLGNREALFGDSPYVDKYITNPPADYNVNPEYLKMCIRDSAMRDCSS